MSGKKGGPNGVVKAKAALGILESGKTTLQGPDRDITGTSQGPDRDFFLVKPL